jgi:hypothetical protein
MHCLGTIRERVQPQQSNAWGEGNGHRGQPAYGRYGAPGEYGWSGEGQGEYGVQGYGPQGFGASSSGWRPEMGRGFSGQEWGARGGAGGYWGQGAAESGYVPGEQRAWEQRQVGGWGEMPFGEPGYGGPAREMTGPMGMFRESIAPGPFTGRGPRGYQRSDARIEEDVNERLTRHPLLDASDVEVRVRGGEVTLTGMVDNRHAKRFAEDIIETISGVKDVNNQLRVQLDRGMVGEETTGATRSQGQATTRSQTPRTQATKTPATTAA